MGCLDQGYDYEDCVGFCFNDEDCTNGSCLDWIGDGYCDDGTWGLVFDCEEWDFDGGDCLDSICESGYVVCSKVMFISTLKLFCVKHAGYRTGEKCPQNLYHKHEPITFVRPILSCAANRQ